MTGRASWGVSAWPTLLSIFPCLKRKIIKVVNCVKSLARKNGEKLKTLNPDVYIVIANDHADQFLLDCVPSFTIHHGKHGKGSFAGRDYKFDINSELATSLVRYAQDEGYDPAFTSSARLDYTFGIPLTFLQIDGPIIPIFVFIHFPSIRYLILSYLPLIWFRLWLLF